MCFMLWRDMSVFAARQLYLLLQGEYEALAVELGLNHAKRENLRARLKAVRMTCPLFDTAQWVRDLERIFLRMWEVHCSGTGPRAFEV